MAYEVFGPYYFREDAINTVIGLELKGYKASNITLFTNEKTKYILDDRTDVYVKSNLPDDEKSASIKSKVQKVFINNFNFDEDIQDKLSRYGLSEKQIATYTDAIESGQILMIVDNELKMGHDATRDTVILKEPVFLPDT